MHHHTIEAASKAIMTESATDTTTFHMTLPKAIYKKLVLKAAQGSEDKQKTVQQLLRELAEAAVAQDIKS